MDATQSDLETQFGEKNIAAWSQNDPNPDSADTDRIALAIEHAKSKIQGFFSFTPPTNSVTTRWIVVFAGIDLWKSKGSDNPDQFDDLLRETRNEIAMYMSGILTFDSQTDVDHPVAIVPE